MLGDFVLGLLRIIKKIIRPFLFLIGALLIFGLAVAWVALIIGSIFSYPFFNFLIPGAAIFSILGIFNLLFLVGIPLLSLVLVALKLFFGAQFDVRWKSGLWIFWGLNFVSLLLLGSFTARNFSQGTDIEYRTTTWQGADTLYIEIEENPYKDMWYIFDDDLQVDENRLVSGHVSLNIEEAEGTAFVLSEIHSSRGGNLDEANQLANEIKYLARQDGNKLILSPNFVIEKGQSWRGQQVELDLQIPEGKHIIWPKKARGILHRKAINRQISHPYPYYDHYWKMEDGQLIAPDWINRNNQTTGFNNIDFDQLQIDGPLEVTIEKGDHFKVELTGREAYTEQIEIEQAGTMLNIYTKLRNTNSSVRLHVTMPELSSVALSNTKDANIKGFTQDAMTIKVDNRSETSAFIDVKELTIYQDDRSKIKLTGKGETMNVAISDNAWFDADQFDVKVADVKADYPNELSLSVTDTLRKQLRSEHNLTVIGGPVVITEDAEQ